MVKEFIIERLGNCKYEESFWTGKKEFSINGVSLTKTSKTSFEGQINEMPVIVNLYGNFLKGLDILIGNETINLIPKTLWFEYLFMILSFLIPIVWGNSEDLCLIIPVVGGAIGGALGGLCAVLTLVYSKNTQNKLYKVLIGIGGVVATFVVCFLAAILFYSLFY